MATPGEKLLPLVKEVNRGHIDDYVRFLTEMQTPDDFSVAVAHGEEIFGADYNQMFGPLMIKLYSQDKTVKQAIHAKVRKLGVPDDVIEDYFTHHIVNGPLAVNILMGNMIPDDKKGQFTELTGQIMLDCLKSYAGL